MLGFPGQPGPRGPQGPPGPEGPKGPQGPKGTLPNVFTDILYILWWTVRKSAFFVCVLLYEIQSYWMMTLSLCILSAFPFLEFLSCNIYMLFAGDAGVSGAQKIPGVATGKTVLNIISYHVQKVSFTNAELKQGRYGL